MRRSAAIALLGIASLLAGCANLPGGDPRVDAVPVSTATCPETFDEGHAEAGLVPKGFEAVAVLRCDPYASHQEGDEVWSGTLLERLQGDLEPVLAALATPSDPRSLGPCAAVAYLVPELWLERADGDVVRVAIPADGCGAPKEVGLKPALDALTVVDQTFTRDSVLESPDAVTAGCATQAGVLVLAGPDEPDGLDAGSIVPDGDEIIGDEYLIPYEMPGWPEPSEVTGARLCDYAGGAASETAPAPVGDAGMFIGARDLAATEAQALVSNARLAPAAPSCAHVATRFVSVHILVGDSDAGAFTVELDGCRRLVTPALHAHAASADMLTLLTPPN